MVDFDDAIGSTVEGAGGEIGKLTGLLPSSTGPWGVVEPAEATEGERILPLHEAQILGDRVVVPFSPHVVVAGPEAARFESGIEPSDEADLLRHYGLTHVAGQQEENVTGAAPPGPPGHRGRKRPPPKAGPPA